MEGADTQDAPSDSSSDFYDHHSPVSMSTPQAEPRSLSNDMQPWAVEIVPVGETEPEVIPAMEVDMPETATSSDDSSSEMDFSNPSHPPTPDSLPDVVTSHAGAKRKLSHILEDANGGDSTSPVEDPSKKQKTSVALKENDGKQERVMVPAAIWQHIFAQLPPAMLCRCLRVSKAFNHYLTGMRDSQRKQKDKSTLSIVDSEVIWTHSRKAFFPQLPRPLASFSELGMLKLLGGKSCQFCAKEPTPAPATSVYNQGPGPNGVRVIFPFGVRSCGLCLEPCLLKDIQLLSDELTGKLRLGIPFGFRSPDFHFVADSVRQMPGGGIPGHLRFAKVYYKPDLDKIRAEYHDAVSLGDGAADEWRKGLPSKGKAAMADSARWEKWELQSRHGTVVQVLREYDLSSFPRHVQEIQSRSAGFYGTLPSSTANGTHPLPQPVHAFSYGYGSPFQLYQPSQIQSQLQQLQHPLQYSHQAQHSRPVRNAQDVEAARQVRKAEIERRCRELEPPVEPNVLQHMESFQAAMQITLPFTDSTWDLLKPRILAQRENAELAEHQRASQLAALQAAIPSAISEESITKPAKEAYDRDYEEAQMPLRRRLGEYADDFINGRWAGGKMLGRENAAIFAVQVLVQVRSRYIEDQQLGLLPNQNLLIKKTHSKQGTPEREPFLSLDNMKWLYDNRVKPLTGPHRKEDFICAGCDESKTPKWFAFESLIQHYGAKHTTAFSKGNIVVHWQTAEWPESPPFCLSPPTHPQKLDRRTFEVQNHGRTRHSHQSNDHENPSNSPHSTNHAAPSPYLNNHHILSPAASAHIQLYSEVPSDKLHEAAAAEARIEASHATQITKLSRDAREIWNGLEAITDLLEPIKVQTVLHHAEVRFKSHFHQKPALDLLTDALASEDSMRPIKNAAGLACKSCVAASENAGHELYWTRIRGLKLYNTSSLITHFKIMHQDQFDAKSLGWAEEMIELPDQTILTHLTRTPGMNEERFALIASAFSDTFPSSLLSMGIIIGETQEGASDSAPAKALLGRLGKKQQKHQQNQKTKRAGRTDHKYLESSEELLPQARDDEYDPLRPALIYPLADDPAQFDTDVGKPVRQAPDNPSPVLPTNSFNLAPETLAALQNLSSLGNVQTEPQPLVTSRVSRSPSVGRARPTASLLKSSGGASVTRSPATQPDIAAILASLTGQTQAKTPMSSVSHSPGNGSRPWQSTSHETVQFEPAPPYQSAHRRSNSRYNSAVEAPAPTSVASLIPSPSMDQTAAHGLYEQQAPRAYNAQQVEQNRHSHHTQLERRYATPSYGAHQYQYVYNDKAGHSQLSHTPTYRETTIQYIQVPERDHAPQNYQYQPPVSKPMYVDQYGRPLIPIDAAPAPVQYVSTPYDPQHYNRRPGHTIYTSMAPTTHFQPVHDDRRPVYYEQIPTGGSDMPPRYAYDDGCASVPRS